MSVDVVHSIEPLETEWEELAERVGAPPFLRPGYVRAWCEAFDHGPLEVLALRRDGALAALIPLQRHRGAAKSTANEWTDVFGPLARDLDAAAELARELFARRPRRVDLQFLHTSWDGTTALRDAAAIAGYRIVETVLQRSPYVELDAGWEEYEKGLEAKLRREVRRRRRRLEEKGELRLEISDGTSRLDALLDEGFAVEAAAWKGGAGTSMSSTAQTERFYRAMARWAAAEGTLRLAFLRLDERPLAFDFCLEHGGSHYLLKTGYDPEQRALAPGIIMRAEMIKRAFDAGLASYEFLGKDQEWKLRWTGARREQVRLRAFAPSFAGRADHAYWTRARPLAKRVLRRG